MKKGKIVFALIMLIMLSGCEMRQTEQFNELGFFAQLKTAMNDVNIFTGSSLGTNLEYSERIEEGLKVMYIELMYDEETENLNRDYYDIINKLRSNMNLDLLRKNYDLIQINFLNEVKNGNTATNDYVYEYVNLTNTFAEGNHSLTGKGMRNFE